MRKAAIAVCVALATVLFVAAATATSPKAANGVSLTPTTVALFKKWAQRPARFATDDAMAKLDRVRAEYDPDGLFNSWMGRL